LAKLKQEVFKILEFLDILEEFLFPYPEEKAEIYWGLYSRPIDILEKVSDANKTTSSQEEKFMNNLELEKVKFLVELKDIKHDFENVRSYNDYKLVKENATFTMNLMEKIEKAKEKVKNFNEREIIFK